jgi:hypothetical protein
MSKHTRFGTTFVGGLLLFGATIATTIALAAPLAILGSALIGSAHYQS